MVSLGSSLEVLLFVCKSMLFKGEIVSIHGENALSKKRFSYFNFLSDNTKVGQIFSLFLKLTGGMRNLRVVSSPEFIKTNKILLYKVK